MLRHLLAAVATSLRLLACQPHQEEGRSGQADYRQCHVPGPLLVPSWWRAVVVVLGGAWLLLLLLLLLLLPLLLLLLLLPRPSAARHPVHLLT
jgi:hypothetical protein